MKLPQPCYQCGATQSHGYRYARGEYVCATCIHVGVRVSYNTKSYRQQQEKHQKDLIQPFAYSQYEKKMVPNKDFIKVYGKKKFEAFSAPKKKEDSILPPRDILR